MTLVEKKVFWYQNGEKGDIMLTKKTGDKMLKSIFSGWSFLKWLGNGIIMILTVALLSFFVNPIFAVGYVIMLLIHETGHIVAARAYDAIVRFGGFTPFGAYIEIINKTSIKENAIIAISGPLCGLLATILYLFLFYFLKDYTFLWLSFFGAVVSLLNLLPLNPFDGGKVIAGTFKTFPLLFIPFLAYGIYYSMDQMILLVLFTVMILYIIYDFVSTRRRNRFKDLVQYKKSTRASIFLVYLLVFVLLGALIFTMVMEYREALLPQIDFSSHISQFQQWLNSILP